MDELVTAAKALKGKTASRRRCASTRASTAASPSSTPRAARCHRRRHASAIDTDASKAAVQWYLDLFKNGLGMTAADLGDGWCGEALGKKHVAITFEGGWLDPAMTGTYPDVKYAWAEMPTGSSGSRHDLVHGQLLDRAPTRRTRTRRWVLLTYLAGRTA